MGRRRGHSRVDHRYVVLGYVRDEGGRPLLGNRVRVERLKTGLSYRAETDAWGFYLVVVHLHDEDVGDLLQITVGRATVRIRARFDPGDARTPRGTQIDFRDGRAQERPEMFVETLPDYLRR